MGALQARDTSVFTLLVVLGESRGERGEELFDREVQGRSSEESPSMQYSAGPHLGVKGRGHRKGPRARAGSTRPEYMTLPLALEGSRRQEQRGTHTKGAQGSFS